MFDHPEGGRVMAFSTDYECATWRHFNDAEHLQAAGRIPNAGYHFGVAAECAFKTALSRAGAHNLPHNSPINPMWKHFGNGTGSGALKQKAMAFCTGRLAAPLIKLYSLASDPNFMSDWEIRMRYAPDHDVSTGPLQQLVQ